jgi:hypothetical protein
VYRSLDDRYLPNNCSTSSALCYHIRLVYSFQLALMINLLVVAHRTNAGPRNHTKLIHYFPFQYIPFHSFQIHCHSIPVYSIQLPNPIHSIPIHCLYYSFPFHSITCPFPTKFLDPVYGPVAHCSGQLHQPTPRGRPLDRPTILQSGSCHSSPPN